MEKNMNRYFHNSSLRTTVRSAKCGSFQIGNGRRAVTLIELLIVIAIIVSLMAVAVPVVRLATDGNKVATLAEEVRSFVSSVQSDAKLEGRGFLIFERNHNNPNLCYRIFRGKPRPDYRGEDFTSYAVPAGEETVEMTVGSIPMSLTCLTFYLYNADVGKVQAFQTLKLDGRMEAYKIMKARVMPASTDVVNQSVYRPVVKVFAAMNYNGPGTSFSPFVPFSQTVAPLMPSGNWNDWNDAFSPNPSGVENDFWPPSPMWTNTSSNSSYDATNDFPNANSATFGFSVTQPPYVDEMNFLTFPEGTALHLNMSGFDTEGVNNPSIPGSSGLQGTVAQTQFAFPVDLEDLESDTAAATTIHNETATPATDPANNYMINLPPQSSVRTAYFPMVEFGAAGQIDRAYASSQLLTSMLSLGADVVRTAPFSPSSPLYLHIGKDSNRSSPILDKDDYLVVVHQQTGRASIAKVEDSMGTVSAARSVIAGSVSE